MTIKFNQAVKHGIHQFIPGVAVSVPGAEEYFIAAGWAETTDDESVFTYEDVIVDPRTRFSETGHYVLPEVAQADIQERGEEAPTPQEISFRAGLVEPNNG